MAPVTIVEMAGAAVSGYSVERRPPTPAEHRRICVDVGWEAVINFDAAPASLARSLHACVAVCEEVVVGMGRIVGDGAVYLYVQDVAVLRAHQGRGVGALILADLVDWLRVHAPERAFVGLFAAAGSEPFYRRFGFEAHAGLTGMFQVAPFPPAA